ncbi:MAG TPA: F0F1 ATP synthase subunit A [Bacteroidales bacterium]|nr:F0F1 ATP synthase subunit A [Bacteroidales bacterium]HNS46334.1 F0F1 ATP synthase subunit A [Bacteroidales bacterium]
MKRKRSFSVLSFLLFFLLFVFPLSSIALSEPEAHSVSSSEPAAQQEEEFNAGNMIIEHVIDAHEWHIISTRKKDVSIPLPVILLDQGKLHVFMSSGFHHGTASYRGFKLETEGKNKGKIVRVTGGGMETDEQAPLPLDFSITKNVFALFISCIVICVIFISVARAYRKREHHAPKGLQSLLEPVILFVRDLAKSSIGEHKYERFMPYLLTLFFFIFLNNLIGVIPFFPGGANVTGNIAVTGVMAIITFIVTIFSGNKDYWKHIVNTPGVPWWLKFPLPLMPVVEIMGVFTKPFILMIRLFANITAGHIIILGFISLIFIFGQMNAALGYGISVVSILFAVFMGLLELLVAFIQAYVFTLLSALYFGMAQEEHH